MAQQAAAPTLFCPSKLAPSAKLPAKDRFVLRPLKRDDFDKGFSSLLGELTDVEGLTKADFENRFDELKKNGNYYIVVVEDTDSPIKIVGSATLLVEDKFVHKNGRVGHIEDVVVSGAYRKHKFGFVLIEQLKHIGWARGCYKIILDCSEKNVGFYQRCGFATKEIQMALYKAKL